MKKKQDRALIDLKKSLKEFERGYRKAVTDKGRIKNSLLMLGLSVLAYTITVYLLKDTPIFWLIRLIAVVLLVLYVYEIFKSYQLFQRIEQMGDSVSRIKQVIKVHEQDIQAKTNESTEAS